MLFALSAAFAVTALPAFGQNAPDLLTSTERAWLRAHGPLRYPLQPDNPPFSLVRGDGQGVGLTVDLMASLGRHLGVEVQAVRLPDGKLRSQAVQRGEVDFLAAAVLTEGREGLQFSHPYLSVPNVLFVNRATPQSGSLKDMAGQRVGVVRNSAPEQWLSGKHPQVSLVRLKSTRDGLLMLSVGQLAGVVANLPVGRAHIAEYSFDNLRILPEELVASPHHLAVKKGGDQLLSILQKGLDSITEAERQQVVARWIGPEIAAPAWRGAAWLWETAIFIAVGLLLVATWSHSLRRRAETLVRQRTAEVRESEARFKVMADAAPMMIWVAGPDTLCTDFNRPWLDFTGRTLEQELGNGWAEGVHPEDVQGCVKRYLDAFHARRPFELEYRLRRADGQFRWIMDRGQPRFLADGTFAGYIGSCIDVTERRQTEAALRRRDAILESVGTAAAGLLGRADWRTMADEALRGLGRSTDASRAYVFECHRGADGALLASQRFEWVAEGVQRQLDNPELQDLPMLAAGFGRWAETLGKGDVVAGHVREFPGTEQAVLVAQGIRSLVVVPIQADGGLWGFLGFDECRAERVWSEPEIGALRVAARTLGAAIERERREKALRESEDRFRTMVEQSPVSIQVLAPDGRTLQVNHAWEELWGATLSDLKDYNLLRDPQIEELGVLPHIRAAFEGRATAIPPVEYDTPRALGKGTKRWVQARIYPVTDKTGHIQHVVLMHEDITERKQAEATLRESEARYQSLVETLPQGIFRKDRDGRFIFANRQFCLLLGRSAGEVLGKTDADFYPAELAAKYRQDDRQVIAAGRIFEAVEEHQVPSGETRYVQVIKIPLRGAAGQVEGVQGIFWDVTEHHQAEVAMRRRLELQDQLEKIATTVPGVICSFRMRPDGSTCMPYASPLLEEIFGLLPAEVKEDFAPGFARLHPDDLGHVNASIAESARTMQLWHDEFRIRHPGKGELWVEGRSVPRREPDGSILWHGFLYDVTGRKRAEQMLRESQRQLATLMDNLPGMVYRCANTPDWPMSFVNEGCAALTGYPSVALMQNQPAFGDLILPEDRKKVWDGVQAALASRQPFELVYRIATAGKEERWVWERGRGVYGDDGALLFLEGFITDITERRQLEDRLRQSQKMEAVGQLAGGVAHDFNNILTAMLMNVSILQRRRDLDPKVRESLREVEHECNRAADLTRQLLLFGRRSVVQFQRVDLNDLLADFQKMLRRLLGEHIAFEFAGDTDLPPVEADPGMMQQVVVNLCVNARDAMPSGGRLSLRAVAVDAGEEQARLHPGVQPGRFVCLSVSDTGCGMDAATLQHIFEPFFTTKEVGKGTGLGLATVHGIIQQHHGWVEVESAEGRGSTFRVFLPALARAVIEDPAASAVEPVQGGHETILLVEDEPAVRKTIALFLLEWGYRVLEAGKGSEALAVWESRGEEIDLLYTDMQMPGGMTGLDLVGQLRKWKPGLKVIVSSGYSVELAGRDAVDAAGVTFVPKPCPPDDLAAALRKCLDEPQS